MEGLLIGILFSPGKSKEAPCLTLVHYKLQLIKQHERSEPKRGEIIMKVNEDWGESWQLLSGLNVILAVG